jgi:hypothetical protein
VLGNWVWLHGAYERKGLIFGLLDQGCQYIGLGALSFAVHPLTSVSVHQHTAHFTIYPVKCVSEISMASSRLVSRQFLVSGLLGTPAFHGFAHFLLGKCQARTLIGPQHLRQFLSIFLSMSHPAIWHHTLVRCLCRPVGSNAKLITNQLTVSMELSSTRQATSCVAIR